MTQEFGMKATAALGLVALLASAGCAVPYAYDFHLTAPSARAPASPGGAETTEDADLRAEIFVDVAAGALSLKLTNKTDQVLQIDWAAITLTRDRASVTGLRPDVDLGWLQPGATVAARLVVIALPHSGPEAVAYEGRRFQLNVPAVVRRQSTVYHYALTAHVRAL
ncbi:MAG TPA: hypothetical protein VKZ18_19240 [Polyangia bacterium]|nr:hypothetical protein [Polyangia bacterium]